MSKDKKYTKNEELKLVGDEPKNCELDKIHTNHAYYHFNYYYSLDDSIGFFEKFIENDKDLTNKFKFFQKNKFPQNIGWIAKMKQNNVSFEQSTDEYFNRFLDAVRTIKIPKVEKKKEKVAVRKDNELLLKLEATHDDFVTGKLKTFDASVFFQINIPSFVDLKVINDYYTPIYEEIKSVNTDKKVREGYANYSKYDLKRLEDFYGSIVLQTGEITVEKKRTKKTRKPKPVSVTKKVSKLRYLEKDTKLNISSLSPEKVLTSNLLFIYNSAKRKLYMLVAAEEKFTVNGISITGVNAEKSFVKTIRKSEMIKEFVAGTKTALVKKFDEIKTVPGSVEKYGTTTDSLILRAFS